MALAGMPNSLPQLRALGGMDLTRADGTQAQAVLSQPKRFALLFYLAAATPRGFHRKDTLLALFWPEAPDHRAHRALNRAVYYLRQSLDRDVVLRRGDADVAVDAQRLWCDTVAFEQALDAGRADEALDLYRGDLAPGFHVDGVPEFERWLESERGRLRRRACDAALALAGRDEKRGDLALAAHWAHRATMLAPHDERAVQLHITLLDGSGDRAGALDAYAAFAARVRHELGVEPAPETESLQRAVRSRTATALRTASSPPPVVFATENAGGDGYGQRAPMPVLPTPPANKPVPRRWIIVAAGGVLIAAGIFALASVWRPRSTTTLGRRSAVTVAPEVERWPSLSPDGGTVYYTVSTPAGDELFAQQLDGGGHPVPLSAQLPGSPRAGEVSPDGRRILFRGDDGLYVMPSLGGQARRVVGETLPPASVTLPGLLPGNWAPDGAHIVYPERDTLFIQALGSGERNAIASGIDIHSPAWSHDGRWIAFVLGNAAFHVQGNIAPSAIGVVPAGGGAIVKVTDASALHLSPVWVPGRRSLLFISDREGGRDIYEVALDATGVPRGAPRRITTGLNPERLSISADGKRLAWSVFTETSNIWMLDIRRRDSVPLSLAAAVTTGNQLIEGIGGVSRDGTWLYYHSDRSGNADLWRAPLGGGVAEQLTADLAPDFAPAVSADGRELAFHSLRTGNRDIFVMPSGGGRAAQVSNGLDEETQPAWSPDGHALIWRTRATIRIARRDDTGRWGTPAVLLTGTLGGGWAQGSPDGRWISCPATDGIEMLDPVSGKRQLLSEGKGVTYHAWSADARTIYGVRVDRDERMSIIAIPVGGGPARTLAWADHPLTQLPRYGLAVHGTRLYFPMVERRADIWMGEIKVP